MSSKSRQNWSLSRFLVASLLFSLSWAKPLAQRAHIAKRARIVETDTSVAENVLGKRQTVPFAVSGVSGGGVQPRLEIRQLMQNTNQFNIYVLAMQAMQNDNQDDFLSYFSIAGIHGRPEQNWDGVSGIPNTPVSGYCPHTSNVFLPWHRPYLALYEQLVQSYAMQVANQFPAGALQDTYRAAASTLRIPYWDWALSPPSGQNSLPDSVAQPTITVTTPNGTQTIDNPLYAYTFHPMEPGIYWHQFLQWPQTLRWPSTKDANATTQVAPLLSTLNNQQTSWSQRIYNLFVLDSNYNFMDFSNEIFNPASSSSQVDSIESVHNSIHTEIGGPNLGHMGIIDVSAFDPVFWMHHAMVDRCFALWQAVYPQSYVEPYAQSVPSYWYDEHQVLDETSNLLPFHSDASGNFWTSDSVRDHTAFSYTYPELQSGNISDVVRAINTLYGSQFSGSVSKHKRQTYSNDATTSNPKQYIANIKTQKYALDTSYSIYFFLGKPSSDPAQWPFDCHLVGTMGVMSTMQSGTLQPVVVSGSVPLTGKIREYVDEGLISSMDDDVVTAYLKCELQWAVKMADGTVIDPTDVPGLVISVISVEMQPATCVDKFPTPVNAPTTHKDVTSGKPGGLSNSTSTY